LSCKNVNNEFYGTEFEGNQKAFAFNLTDQYNKPFSLNKNNDIKIITFLYTSCTDICPTITLKLREIYNNLDKFKNKFRIIVITVDPVNDTPESILKYSEAYKMADKWLFLTGNDKKLSEIWEKYYISTWITQNNNPNALNINHAAPIYIIDQNQNIKLLHSEPIVTQEIVHDIKLLISK